jgi:primosomal protein N' (replication factor Y)
MPQLQQSDLCYCLLPIAIDTMFAEIIIPLALPKNYTWLVPEHLLELVKVGCRVEVELGKNKDMQALSKHCTSENQKHSSQRKS